MPNGVGRNNRRLTRLSLFLFFSWKTQSSTFSACFLCCLLAFHSNVGLGQLIKKEPSESRKNAKMEMKAKSGFGLRHSSTNNKWECRHPRLLAYSTFSFLLVDEIEANERRRKYQKGEPLMNFIMKPHHKILLFDRTFSPSSVPEKIANILQQQQTNFLSRELSAFLCSLLAGVGRNNNNKFDLL